LEVPYVGDLLERLEFDTIYHEHLCYFSVTALDALFRRHGLWLHDVRHQPIHGGSLRISVGRERRASPSTVAFLEREAAEGLADIERYRAFAHRVADLQRALRTRLRELRRAGRTVAAYGAAAKGTILLNSSGISSDLVAFVADKSPYKQGRLLPGVGIPIRPPESILAEMPDAVVMLAWNIRDEILREQHRYLRAGGRFIVPIPWPVEIDLASAPAPPGPLEGAPA
jgi:hypothetical protein